MKFLFKVFIFNFILTTFGLLLLPSLVSAKKDDDHYENIPVDDLDFNSCLDKLAEEISESLGGSCPPSVNVFRLQRHQGPGTSVSYIANFNADMSCDKYGCSEMKSLKMVNSTQNLETLKDKPPTEQYTCKANIERKNDDCDITNLKFTLVENDCQD